MTHKKLLRVANAWSHKDDWEVPTIQLTMLGELAECLDAGDDPRMLRLHAKHAGNDCNFAGCAVLIPHLMEGRILA